MRQQFGSKTKMGVAKILISLELLFHVRSHAVLCAVQCNNSNVKQLVALINKFTIILIGKLDWNGRHTSLDDLLMK